MRKSDDGEDEEGEGGRKGWAEGREAAETEGERE
jgi:hypothetical protein